MTPLIHRRSPPSSRGGRRVLAWLAAAMLAAGCGTTVVNPWVSLPGTGNGLMRGAMYVDRTGVMGGDLIVVTDAGELWRVTSAAVISSIFLLAQSSDS